jgi:hypothetical protein
MVASSGTLSVTYVDEFLFYLTGALDAKILQSYCSEQAALVPLQSSPA